MAVQPKIFEDLEGPDFVRSSDVEAVGEKVLDLHGGIGGVARLHPIAEAIRDGELSILWLMNEKPFNDETEDDQEPEIAGRCVKAPRLWHDVTGHHFAIWIRKHFWDLFGSELRRAVVLHELLHIEVKRDKDGQPKFAVRKHDVEDFVDVARQYGPNALAGDGGRYVRAAAQFAGEPEPILSRKHGKDKVVRDAAHAVVEAVAPPATREDLHRQIDREADAMGIPGDDQLPCVGSNHVPGCEHAGGVVPMRTVGDA